MRKGWLIVAAVGLMTVSTSQCLTDFALASTRGAMEATEAETTEEEESSEADPTEEEEGSEADPTEEEEGSEADPTEEEEGSEADPTEEEESSEADPTEEEEGSEADPTGEEESSEADPTEEEESSEEESSQELPSDLAGGELAGGAAGVPPVDIMGGGSFAPALPPVEEPEEESPSIGVPEKVPEEDDREVLLQIDCWLPEYEVDCGDAAAWKEICDELEAHTPRFTVDTRAGDTFELTVTQMDFSLVDIETPGSYPILFSFELPKEAQEDYVLEEGIVTQDILCVTVKDTESPELVKVSGDSGGVQYAWEVRDPYEPVEVLYATTDQSYVSNPVYEQMEWQNDYGSFTDAYDGTLTIYYDSMEYDKTYYIRIKTGGRLSNVITEERPLLMSGDIGGDQNSDDRGEQLLPPLDQPSYEPSLPPVQVPDGAFGIPDVSIDGDNGNQDVNGDGGSAGTEAPETGAGTEAGPPGSETTAPETGAGTEAGTSGSETEAPETGAGTEAGTSGTKPEAPGTETGASGAEPEIPGTETETPETAPGTEAGSSGSGNTSIGYPGTDHTPVTGITEIHTSSGRDDSDAAVITESVTPVKTIMTGARVSRLAEMNPETITFEKQGIALHIPTGVITGLALGDRDQLETKIEKNQSSVTLTVKVNGKQVGELPGATVQIPYEQVEDAPLPYLQGENGETHSITLYDAKQGVGTFSIDHSGTYELLIPKEVEKEQNAAQAVPQSSSVAELAVLVTLTLVFYFWKDAAALISGWRGTHGS